MRVDPVAIAIAEEHDSAILIEDADHAVVFGNRRWHELVAGESAGIEALIERLEPDEAIRARGKFAQSDATLTSITFQSRMTTPDARRWVQIARYPVLDDNGSPTAWVTSVSDRPIPTDSVQSVAPQDDVLAGVERLLHVGAWDWKLDADIMWWSEEALRMCGVQRREFAGTFTAFTDLVHPDDVEEVRTYVGRALDAEQPFDMRLRIVRPDGAEVMVHARGEVVRDEAGDSTRMLGTFEDITSEFEEIKDAEHSARALATLRRGNRVLPTATDTHVLVQEICAAAVDAGKYTLAWFGTIDDGASAIVRVVDAAGPAIGYVEDLVVTWGDHATAYGPVGTAVRLDRTVVVADVQNDPGFGPWREKAAEFGLRSTIALPVHVGGRATGVLAVYAEEPDCFDHRAEELLEELALELGLGLDRIHVAERMTAAREDTIRVLAATVEIRDPYTAGHQARVAELARRIGETMGLAASELQGVHLAGLVHDVGKVSVPAEILTRPGVLRAAEFELIKEHPAIGEHLLSSIRFPWPIAEMVGQHHERWNGSGYPRGLVGTEILLGARILAVADVVEAMSRFRPYREALGTQKAVEEIVGYRGVLFDPDVVDACLVVLNDGFDFGSEAT